MPVFQRTHAVLGCETCIKVSDCTQLSWLGTHTPLPYVRRHEAPRGRVVSAGKLSSVNCRLETGTLRLPLVFGIFLCIAVMRLSVNRFSNYIAVFCNSL